MGDKGTGSADGFLGLQTSCVVPLPQFPPEAEQVLTLELLKLLLAL